MPQITDSVGHLALKGANYSLPQQGLPICLPRLLHLKNPLIVLDLILTLGRFPLKIPYLGIFTRPPILAQCIVNNRWFISDPQVLHSCSVYSVGGTPDGTMQGLEMGPLDLSSSSSYRCSLPTGPRRGRLFVIRVFSFCVLGW